MAQKANLYRRGSGVYVVRMVVPLRLREVVGKCEVHTTTGTREPAVAKAVAAGLIAHWRQKFLSLERIGSMDLHRMTAGSPLLTGGGHLRLSEAAAASGFDEDELLRKVAEGRLGLFVRVSALPGHLVSLDSLESDPEGSAGVYVVPSVAQMPDTARTTEFTGLLVVRAPKQIASSLMLGASIDVVLFDVQGRPAEGFAPTKPFEITIHALEVEAAAIEALRAIVSASITPEQRVLAGTLAPTVVCSAKSRKPMSEAVAAFMADRERGCAPDQARRIRTACDLFVELEGDPAVRDVDRDRLRRYRDVLLPRVPANLDRLRAKVGGKRPTVLESIELVEGTGKPLISLDERGKRMNWLASMFAWLTREGWIASDPSEGLGGRPPNAAEPKKRSQDSRELFTQNELQTIFSANWYRTGRGEKTAAGTYREFLPYYYWLPLLGLYTGARINELCQLRLDDLGVTPNGVHYISIVDGGDGQRLKNSNSVRQIPLHNITVRLLCFYWRDRLRAEGFDRLFPELQFDPVKGYSKAAVKWFSSYAASLGWPRDGKKTFHSFRHTFATACFNELGLPEATAAQLTGHKRGSNVLADRYRKDELPDVLVNAIERLDFGLPQIAPFDIEAGIQALHDALRRRRKK